MAKDTIHLTVGYYNDEESAKLVLDSLESMHRNNTITLVDAALLTREEDGKLTVHETHELTTGKGARRGAAILGVVGLIYPPSFIASAVLGGGIGALAGRIRDTGIKKDQMQRIAEQLEPGMLALATLSDEASTRLIVDTIEAAGGKRDSHELGPETSEDVVALARETAGDPAE